MEITNQILFIAALLLITSILASGLSSRFGAPLLLVFLVLGMLAGEEGPGGIQFSNVQFAHLAGSLALAIILFDGGLRTRVATFRVGLWPAASLATCGVLVTTAGTGLFAAWVLGFSRLEGLLIGAIVGSTDAAAVFSLLRSQGLQLNQRVAATLEIESGSNDPMAIFLTIALIDVLMAGQTAWSWAVFGQFVTQMGLGSAVGIAGGYALVGLINRMKLEGALYPLLAMAGGLFIFAGVSVIGGSGFLAIYLAGVVLGNRKVQASQYILRVHDGLAWLSQIVMFVMLGLLVTPSSLLPFAPQAMAIATVLMLVARPIAVWLSLLPFHFPWREQAFIAWVGLRGSVPIILALFPLLAGLEHAAIYFNVAFFVVLVSLLLQGWTVAPAARLLGLEIPPVAKPASQVDIDMPGRADYELIGYRLPAESLAATSPIDELHLPETSRLAAILRDEQPLHIARVQHLAPGDYVHVLAPASDIEALNRIFAAPRAPQRLEGQKFFGEFVLNGNAKLADIAALYGFNTPDEAHDATLSEVLTTRFNNRPVVGDRAQLGPVQLVIREMDGNEISKIGLKLHQ